MNAWVYRMKSWRRRFAITVESWQRKPRAGGRNYWDRQSRAWSDERRLAYAIQRSGSPVEVRRRSR